MLHGIDAEVERELRRHEMDERNKEKLRQHRIQPKTELYGSDHLVDNNDARRL